MTTRSFCYDYGRCDGILRVAQRLSQMQNENRIRKRVFLRLLGSPFVLAPLVLGSTACTAIWALGIKPAFGWFAVLAGFLGAAGAYLTRLIFDGGRTAQAVLADLEREERQARQATLDDLDRRLTQADNDPRPEVALRDLRELAQAFEEFAGRADEVHLPVVVEVRSRVRQLFDQSIRSLEQTLKLGDIGLRLKLPEARQPILEQREKIVADIQASVKQLGGTLAALQRLQTGSQNQSELARLRDELDQSLQLAGRVEERLNALWDQAVPGHPESTTRPAAHKE